MSGWLIACFLLLSNLASCSDLGSIHSRKVKEMNDLPIQCLRGYTVTIRGDIYNVTRDYNGDRINVWLRIEGSELKLFESNSAEQIKNWKSDLFDREEIFCALDVIEKIGSYSINSIGGKEEYVIIYTNEVAYVYLFGRETSLERLRSVREVSWIADMWYYFPVTEGG